jgi:hypothetical protein
VRTISRSSSGSVHPLENVSRHRQGQLVLPHEYGPDVLFAQQFRFLIAVRPKDDLDLRVSFRATSTILRTWIVSGVAITSMLADATCA